MKELKEFICDGRLVHIYSQLSFREDAQLFLINDGDIFIKYKDEILSAIKDIDNIVLAFVHSNNRFHEYTPWKEDIFRKDYPFSGGAKDYLVYLMDSLVPSLEKKLDLEFKRDRIYLAGASLGGLLSLYGSLEYPDFFGGAICISSSFWYDNFLSYIRNKKYTRLDQTIYIDVGDREGRGKITLNRDVLELTKEVYSTLLEKGFKNISFEIKKDMSHRSNFFVKRLIDAIHILANKKE